MTKRQILFTLLIFSILLLYSGGSYLFLTNKRLRSDLGILASRMKNELVRPTPFPTPVPPPEPARIEITNSPFSTITKQDVEALGEGGGIKEITLLYNPPPQEVKDRMADEASKAGKPMPKLLEGTVKARAIAGFFKKITGDTLILTQKDGKEYAIGLTDATRLWINTNGKLEIVSQFVTKFPDPAALMSAGELVLATNLSQDVQPIQVQTVITFP